MYTDSVQTMMDLREGHEINVSSLEEFMRGSVEGFGGSLLKVKQFKSGQSNPTFFLEDNTGKFYVLRKKPSGQLLKSAHLIEREFRIISALRNVEFPVPRPLIFCENEDVLGTPFYIMEFVKGRIFRDLSLKGMNPMERLRIYDELNRVLAMLHNTYFEGIGLEDFGKSGHFYARQIATWTRQYQASKTSEIDSMNKLIEWLPKNIPEGSRNVSTIVHGDFRLDNVVFHPEEPQILAVLDWELSTLGHPYSDLAYNCMMYHLPAPFGLLGIDNNTTNFNGWLKEMGIPTEKEYLDTYCRRTGVSQIANWTFYLVFSLFRIAGIAQGVYKRALQGNASAPNAMEFGSIVGYLADTAMALIENDRNHSQLHLQQQQQQHISLTHQIPVYSIFQLSEKTRRIRKQLLKFMDEFVYPNEALLEKQIKEGLTRWKVPSLLKELTSKAKKQGLWNLFLPDKEFGGGLTNLEYAPLCEIMGRSAFFAPQIFNCSAPDTGNMEILWKYGSEQQKQQWLIPLLNGEIRSCFAMTEPAVASSDATNIECRIEKDGDYYVINGRKWWTSGAMDPRCKLIIVLGKTDPNNSNKYLQQSMLLVPMDTLGVRIIRPLSSFGYFDEPVGHAEISFENVRVPLANILLGEGRGFEIAQGRLGPGRIHHCMRLIGLSERALEAMCKRAKERKAFGKLLSQFDTIQSDIAQSRVEIEQARLLILKCAHMMDTIGNRAARPEIAMIKIVTPNVALRVIDRAIQIHGAAGVSDDFFLSRAWVYARTIRIADGPDEVHSMIVAKLELSKDPIVENNSRFKKALTALRTVYDAATTEEQLLLYGLFKQATSGDNQENTPSDLRELAKHEAWLKHKGMPRKVAMDAYIKQVEMLRNKKAKL